MTRGRRALLLAVGLVVAAPARAEEITLDRSLRWYGAVELNRVPSSAVNPQNRVLTVPGLALTTELRPDVRLSVADLTLVARPRLGVQGAQARVAGQEQPFRSEPIGTFNELFGSLRASDALEVTYGIQNYEWGPALTLNPSNAIASRPLIQNFLTVIPGRALGRVNLTAGRQLSCVLLVETRPEGSSARAIDRPKAAAKLEYASASDAHYAGIVAGRATRGYSWVGEYGNLQLGEFSLYADARHTLGADTWYPDATAAGGFAQTAAGSKRLYTLAALGWRWGMPRSIDLRVELLHNDAGYTEDDERAALKTLVALNYAPLSVERYVDAARDLRGKNYAFAALYIPDFGPGDSCTAMLRYLFSFTDQSAAAFLDAQWAATDSLELHAFLAQSVGPVPRQLTSRTRTSVTLGARLSW